MSKAKRSWPRYVFDEDGNRYEICTTEEFHEIIRPMFEEAWGISLAKMGAEMSSSTARAIDPRPRLGEGADDGTAAVGKAVGKKR